MPNFDELPQSTAEIKLLPVLENGQPPYKNYILYFKLNFKNMEYTDDRNIIEVYVCQKLS